MTAENKYTCQRCGGTGEEPEAGSGMTWQPIETAPRDGSLFDAERKKYERMISRESQASQDYTRGKMQCE